MDKKLQVSSMIERFGCLTFHLGVMEKKLPKEVFANVVAAMDGEEKINPLYADLIAEAMKNWAMELGATHFCHWFQPLTGKSAEKHDAFLDVGEKGLIIERFSGKWLLKGEPDASSFPSGGLRSTSAARGYSCWDFKSFPFIWKSGGIATLCIPALFFSWCGKALDMKIPLMKSEEKLGNAVLRLLNLFDIKASKVYPTLGCEQEYFLVPSEFLNRRPDLLLTGRTLLGALSPKGQELEDHYFSVMPEKVLSFLKDVEEAALELGIPLKTRHSEVAPQQFELAPLFGRSYHAVDQNMLLMQLMYQIAKGKNLACIFHEKPFAGINGSGKHCNWSLATGEGLNLLDPILLESNPLIFLCSITAVISAVHQGSDLLRSSIASAGNDHRLGGNEAPPAIISVYLGEALEKVLDAVENQREYEYVAESIKDMNIPSLFPLVFDTIDRNRTSPFVFTGNKFEFRSVGASAHPALPVMTLNAIVAQSFLDLVDEIEKEKGQRSLQEASLHVIRRWLSKSRNIRYLGDNYKEEWKREALSRGIPNIEKAMHSFDLLIEPKSNLVFEGVLSLDERRSRVQIFQKTYSHVISQEVRLMIELFDTQIAPAALKYQRDLAENIHWVEKTVGGLSGESKELFLELTEILNQAMRECKILKKEFFKASQLEGSAEGFAFSDNVVPQMKALRKYVDALEQILPQRLWPMPKYREILFSL